MHLKLIVCLWDLAAHTFTPINTRWSGGYCMKIKTNWKFYSQQFQNYSESIVFFSHAASSSQTVWICWPHCSTLSQPPSTSVSPAAGKKGRKFTMSASRSSSRSWAAPSRLVSLRYSSCFHWQRDHLRSSPSNSHLSTCPKLPERKLWFVDTEQWNLLIKETSQH